MSESDNSPPPGTGDVYGPRYPGNLHYNDRHRIPTNHGTSSIDEVRLVRFRNGARQKTVRGHAEADCPACYTTHEVGFDECDDAIAEVAERVLDCCDEVRWLPPSDWLDPCPICGDAHRASCECRTPMYRTPKPDFDRPAACQDCGWTADCAEEGLRPLDSCCPECGSASVWFGDLDDAPVERDAR